MDVVAKCRVHEDAPVYLLEATTSYTTYDGKPVTEQSERSSIVKLDKANLYCSVDEPFNHHLYFAVYNDAAEWVCDVE